MDVVPHEQAYLFLADQPFIQKPVVLIRKKNTHKKGKVKPYWIRALRMLTTRQKCTCNNEMKFCHQKNSWKSRVNMKTPALSCRRGRVFQALMKQHTPKYCKLRRLRVCVRYLVLCTDRKHYLKTEIYTGFVGVALAVSPILCLIDALTSGTCRVLKNTIMFLFVSVDLSFSENTHNSSRSFS